MLFNELMSEPSFWKMEQIVKKWWNIYEYDVKNGLQHLAIILLYSAGIKHETFDFATFPDEVLKRKLFSEDLDFSHAPIAYQSFSKTFGNFIDILLERNYWAIIKDFPFIFDLVSVIEYMMRSPHDSVRAVSYLSSMKIFRHSYGLSEYLIKGHQLDKNSKLSSLEELKKKVHYIFRNSMRDNAAHLRIIPLKEFLSWSLEDPDAMIEDNIKNYIYRGLKDSFIGSRKISLKIFFNIFERPSILNREKQQSLFSMLLSELTISLRSNEELDYLVLKIVNNASGFLDIFITPEEDLYFSMCLYSESESVLREAKTYFYKNHFNGKTGVDIISETFKFYRKSAVKNASKLVHNLGSYFAAHTSWQDWEFCLKSCPDSDVNDYLNIFHLYVSFTESPSLNDLDSATANNMKDEFSVYFSESWLQLMETDKIAMNANAQVLMLKLATSFNVLKIFKKTQAKIIEWTLKKFHQSRNQEVLMECLSCIHSLNSFNKNDDIEHMLISKIPSEFLELLENENEDTELLYLSHFKVHGLVKMYKLTYEALWGPLVSLLEKGRNFEKTELIISVLHHIFLNKIKDYLDLEKNFEVCDEAFFTTEEKNHHRVFLKAEVTRCSDVLIEVASNFIYLTSEHINEYCNLTNFMVPKLYTDLIYLLKDSPVSDCFLALSDAKIESYVIFCSQIININCLQNVPPHLGHCCKLLNDYVKLTMEGKICISSLKFFIINFNEINSHWLIILKIFNFLFAKSNPIGAHVLINGLISCHDREKEKSVDEETIILKLKQVICFILQNVDSEGKGYQNTLLHLYLYIEKLVQEGYIIFTDLMYVVESYLSEEIRMKLRS